MIIGRSADYALRALIHLAQQDRETPVPLEQIAGAQRIPAALLSKILQTLVKAGVLRSHKGYGGGFVLVADPRELNLADVIQAIDGPFTVFECLRDDTICHLCEGCTLRGKFQELQDGMLDMLRRTTVASCLPGAAALRAPAAHG